MRRQIFDGKGDRLVRIDERFLDRLALAVAAWESGHHDDVPAVGVGLEQHAVLRRGHAKSLSRAASLCQANRAEIVRMPLATRPPPRSELRCKLRNDLPPFGLRREPQRLCQRRLHHPDERLRRQPPTAARFVQRIVHRVTSRNVTQRWDTRTAPRTLRIVAYRCGSFPRARLRIPLGTPSILNPRTPPSPASPVTWKRRPSACPPSSSRLSGPGKRQRHAVRAVTGNVPVLVDVPGRCYPMSVQATEARDTMKLRTLAEMSPQKKREAVASLVSASMGPANGQMTNVQARLAEFEKKYGMSTDDMVAAFRAGQLDDTADVAQWLVFSKARGG